MGSAKSTCMLGSRLGVTHIYPCIRLFDLPIGHVRESASNYRVPVLHTITLMLNLLLLLVMTSSVIERLYIYAHVICTTCTLSSIQWFCWYNVGFPSRRGHCVLSLPPSLPPLLPPSLPCSLPLLFVLSLAVLCMPSVTDLIVVHA